VDNRTCNPVVIHVPNNAKRAILLGSYVLQPEIEICTSHHLFVQLGTILTLVHVIFDGSPINHQLWDVAGIGRLRTFKTTWSIGELYRKYIAFNAGGFRTLPGF